VKTVSKTLKDLKPRLVGVELYFDNLNRAQEFYADTLGLTLGDTITNHHAKFDTPTGFVCLERKGVENYPSADKAVLFIEVADLRRTVGVLAGNIVRYEAAVVRPWAVLHDPEGHNILLLQAGAKKTAVAKSRRKQKQPAKKAA
jgi:catechol 2,3-dioxygenase-like lactoylglutathione lyase family enzyme